ncbi:hypothetical protein D9Q81_01930 [Candidatus Korarchaeum cryptofilum]|jgi:hypothetical protein|uniref:Uncharacterized protein n=2 Tax=Candidatus Korarchaeum cryptofilum TaxID=498846 RepID=B1L6Y0_KORCO|nr:hypothetical protein [Candidatus Korarchaeum cryptofilum]ACB08209.1 hypothetical protein Kcr_1463 [Candidatus Korarchaeum cryptofilum OPF8]RSN70091.1 hypothetical protein D9Q81_01930 [Candidatus Korarchaeum cryptofilum]
MGKEVEDLESTISSAVRDLAKFYGYSSEKSLKFISDLTISFLRGILSSKQRFPELAGMMKGDDEWRVIAFYVKRTPTCNSPCFISHDLEGVIREYGFGNSHYIVMLRKMCEEK